MTDTRHKYSHYITGTGCRMHMPKHTWHKGLWHSCLWLNKFWCANELLRHDISHYRQLVITKMFKVFAFGFDTRIKVISLLVAFLSLTTWVTQKLQRKHFDDWQETKQDTQLSLTNRATHSCADAMGCVTPKTRPSQWPVPSLVVLC